MQRIVLFVFCICCVVMVIIGDAIAMQPHHSDNNTLEPLWIQTYEFDRCLTPLYVIQQKAREVIIQDESTFQTYLNNSPECKGIPLPDLTKWTAIGRQVNIPGGCSRFPRYNSFTVRVTKDTNRRLYYHTVVSGIGPCAGHATLTTWHLVPKLPANYRVEFQRFIEPSLIIECGSDEF